MLGKKIIEVMRDVLIYAHKSVDPSTQNAAFLIDDNFNVLVRGVNQIPIGVYYRDDMWERPQKYSFVEHAERFVIYEAAAKGICTKGLIMVCPFLACADCARAIILSGIKCVVRLEMKGDVIHPSWVKSTTIGDEMMRESNVEILDLDYTFDVQLRRNEKLITL